MIKRLVRPIMITGRKTMLGLGVDGIMILNFIKI